MNSSQLFSLTNQVFWGFAVVVVYAAVSAGATYWFQPTMVERYVEDFVVSFNCIISGGLIIGTALFVHSTQRNVPQFIEASFDAASLSETRYSIQKARYLSRARSVRFATYFTLASFCIFYACKFPFDPPAEYFFVAFGCIEYALGIYVGRKLYYIAKMLHAVANVEITADIFREDLLSRITSYVNVLSTMTVIFVYMHVKSYYAVPFEYPFGYAHSLHFLLLLPAIIATPVIVVFNFYPRTVLRQLYSRSIKQDGDHVLEQLRRRNLTEYERLSYVIEYDTLARDELKTRLQLSLSDLPIGLTIVLMIIALFVRP